MPTRLIRVFLALAIAFVFTGRLEAAAAHCAHLMQAEATDAQAQPAMGENCHMGAPQAAKAQQHKSPMPERCECLAGLQACAPEFSTTLSARMAPYAWGRPDAVGFSSAEPLPDWRPPKA